MIAVSTDGASSMVGNENGSVSLLRKYLPNLIGTHCISHHEALAASDASKKIPEFLFVEKLTNKVYHNKWVEASKVCGLLLFFHFTRIDSVFLMNDKIFSLGLALKWIKCF